MKIQDVPFSEIKVRLFADPEVFAAYLEARQEDSPDNDLLIESVELITASPSNSYEPKE